jgi:hypothetical protein
MLTAVESAITRPSPGPAVTSNMPRRSWEAFTSPGNVVGRSMPMQALYDRSGARSA